MGLVHADENFADKSHSNLKLRTLNISITDCLNDSLLWDWNELPDSLISSAELSDDCVSKFTSLVRARD